MPPPALRCVRARAVPASAASTASAFSASCFSALGGVRRFCTAGTSDAACSARGGGARARASSSLAPPPVVHATGSVRVLSGCVDGLPGGVGNTPLVRLRVASAATGCAVLGKAEWMNPGGSIKDRAALGLVAAAEARGALRAGGTVVEGTAGNTGIGLAHICAARGYRLVLYMPDTQSAEKMSLLALLGADVRPVPAVPVTDARHYTFQARDYAAATPGAVWTNQFDSTDNREAHYRSTGPEIWLQTGGAVDAFICATGTGGTLAGTGRYLKEVSGGRVQVWLADPPGSVMHSWVQTGVLERSGGSITEGIGQGRITANMQGAQLDGSLLIEDARTIAAVYRCLRDEGLFIGASSALNVVAATELASRLGPGHTVVTVICDGAYRYQSRLFSRAWLEAKGLYEAVPADCRALVTLK